MSFIGICEASAVVGEAAKVYESDQAIALLNCEGGEALGHTVKLKGTSDIIRLAMP